MLNNGINVKILRVIRNMYADLKSCVTLNNNTSSVFSCTSGVRLGDNLSPLLFSLYLNDLESYLQICRHKGVDIETQSEEMYIYRQILIMMYADDTIIISEDPENFQNCMNSFLDYCAAWKLNINFNKTKIIIFGARNIDKYNFRMGDNKIEIIKQYKYLGVVFHLLVAF